MKRKILLAAAVVLFCVSCGNGDYQAYTYTNQTDKTLQFRTAEKSSPLYVLGPTNSITLPSDARGRGEITYIDKPFVTWKLAGSSGDSIYDILFVDRQSYEVTIKNYTASEITVTEVHGFLMPNTVTVAAAKDASTPGTKIASVFTEKPVWQFSNISGFSWDNEIANDKITLSVYPPK